MVESAVEPVLFPVQVCYASPEETLVIDLEVIQGTTVAQALEQAGLAGRFPEAVGKGAVGIYGRKVPGDRLLAPHDRIEIYRPLADLPQNIRRRRVERLRGQKAEKR